MALEIMECRYQILQLLVEGYKRTGIPLIAYHHDKLLPAATSDDSGLYCIIPQLVTAFNTSLDAALTFFIHGITFASLFLGLIALLLTFKGTLERIVSITALILLSRISYSSVDVYKFMLATAVAIIPWCLYFFYNKRSTYYYVFFALIAGAYIGFAHYFRSYAGGGAFFCFIITLLGNKFFAAKEKIFILLTFILTLSFPSFYFHHLYATQKKYVQEHLPQVIIEEHQHVLWHPIYLGFGFLTNDLGISYNDRIADLKVQALAPNTPYPSPASEAILKNEVISIIKYHKLFVLYTLWAKIGILLFYFLLFANLGIITALFYPKGWCIELSFFCAMGFSSLFSLITVPNQLYLLGFIACATLYGIVSINHAIERGIIKKIKTSMSQLGKFLP